MDVKLGLRMNKRRNREKTNYSNPPQASALSTPELTSRSLLQSKLETEETQAIS
jgi:hypothetical protein